MEDPERRFRRAVLWVTALSYLFGVCVVVFVMAGSHGHLRMDNLQTAAIVYPVVIWVVVATILSLFMLSRGRTAEWSIYRIHLRRSLVVLMFLYALVPVIYLWMEQVTVFTDMTWLSFIPAVIEFFILLLFSATREIHPTAVPNTRMH